MNQADVSKLVSQLRIKVNPRLRKFRSPAGPEGRLNKLRKTVTALIKHERIELNYPRADEARMYAERVSTTGRLFAIFQYVHYSLYQMLYAMEIVTRQQWKWLIIG